MKRSFVDDESLESLVRDAAVGNVAEKLTYISGSVSLGELVFQRSPGSFSEIEELKLTRMG